MINMYVNSWTSFKNLVSQKLAFIQYSETPQAYDLYINDNIYVWSYTINKDSGSEQAEFETNYKASSNKRIGSGDPQPFAIPSFRTKRSAITAPVTCPINATTEVRFLLTEDLYSNGGCMIVKNAEFGDYVTAEVEDIDGVIPAPYRAAICEAWPIVASYIIKEYVEVNNGPITVQPVDTRPLSAKITAGLYLCQHYHAINSGVDREVVVNYYMSKKL